MLQTEIDICLEEAKLAADVITLALEIAGGHAFCHCKLTHRIGELDLTSGSGCGVIENVEYIGSEEHSAEDGEE